MVLPDSDGISRVPLYSGSTRRERSFDYRAVTSYGGPFQTSSSTSFFFVTRTEMFYNPKRQASWFGNPVYLLAATQESHLLSLLPT